jgi:hypothetical protein
MSLRQKYHVQIAVADELCKEPIVYAIHKQKLSLYLLSTLRFLRYETAFSASGANDEPIDAELELDMMLRAPEKTNTQHAQSVGIRVH